MNPRPRHRRCAFTLLEVILGVSLSLILAALVFGFYQRAMDTRRAAMEEVIDVGSIRQILDRMTLELQNSLTYSFLGMGLEGSIDTDTQLPQVRFMTAVLPGMPAWAIRKSTEDPIPPEQDLQFLTYRLNTWTDEFGQLQVGGLERVSQKIISARQVEEGQNAQVTLMSPAIHYLRLRYWTGSSWATTWKEDDLPLAVEVVLGRSAPDSSDEEATCPPGCWRRVIFLPGGVKASSGGTVVRGLKGDE